jgi:hypothetical protein
MPRYFVAAWWPGRMPDIRSNDSDWQRFIEKRINSAFLRLNILMHLA